MFSYIYISVPLEFLLLVLLLECHRLVPYNISVSMFWDLVQISSSCLLVFSFRSLSRYVDRLNVATMVELRHLLSTWKVSTTWSTSRSPPPPRHPLSLLGLGRGQVVYKSLRSVWRLQILKIFPKIFFCILVQKDLKSVRITNLPCFYTIEKDLA